LLTWRHNEGPFCCEEEAYGLNILPTPQSGSNHSIGSRKVVDDSDEDEEVAPAKAPTPKAKPKSQPYAFPLKSYIAVTNDVTIAAKPRKPRANPPRPRTTLRPARSEEPKQSPQRAKIRKILRRRLLEAPPEHPTNPKPSLKTKALVEMTSSQPNMANAAKGMTTI
jgi:hypothetical protein